MEGWKSWGVGGEVVGEAGMKAEPAKAEKQREEGERKGSKEGKDGGRLGEQQSKAAGTQTGKKQIFFLLATGKNHLIFLYNKQSSLSERRYREEAHPQKWINAGAENCV